MLWHFMELIESEYEKDNYRVVDLSNNSNICLIFFSSHVVWYPNTEEGFIKSTVIKDRYEWVNTACVPVISKNVSRIIFCRDIYKQYYIKGINSRQNTIEKTIELLKELSDGMKVITIGSSAGGYMAVVAGIMLGAEYVINNGGRFDITNSLASKEIIQKARVNPENSKYLNTVVLLPQNKIPIFYFYANKHEIEVEDYKAVSRYNCVKCVAFDERKHATSVFPGNWAYIILHQEILQSLCDRSKKKALNKVKILFEIVPKKEAVYIFVHEAIGAVKRIATNLFMGDENA